MEREEVLPTYASRLPDRSIRVVCEPDANNSAPDPSPVDRSLPYRLVAGPCDEVCPARNLGERRVTSES